MFDDYDEVARLTLSDLVHLSRDGGPQERVWAGWALGMRGETPQRVALQQMFERDPNEGVRRHVLIVLVGLGEAHTLRRTVAHEPNPMVRATATTLLGRTTGPNDPVGYDLLVARSLDVSWWVRYALADSLRSDAPTAVIRAVAGLMFDPEPWVRGRMAQRVDAGDFPRRPFAAAREVVRRADRAVVKRDVAGTSSRALVCLRQPIRLL